MKLSALSPGSKPCTAFEGERLLLSGSLIEVALAVRAVMEKKSSEVILVFDDATGRVVDLDLRGGNADIVDRLSHPPVSYPGYDRSGRSQTSDHAKNETSEPKGRGRPRLGVVSREVTLLPRHWEWLAAQPGGASAVIRRLVDEARRTGGARQQRRVALEAAYHFMHAIGGDLPGYEEATRALFADDRPSLERRISKWPKDICSYIMRLAFGGRDPLEAK